MTSLVSLDEVSDTTLDFQTYPGLDGLDSALVELSTGTVIQGISVLVWLSGIFLLLILLVPRRNYCLTIVTITS